MSKDDQFSFTPLEEEEDDDDEAKYQSGSLDLQPHSSQLPEESSTDPISNRPSYTERERYDGRGGFDNPALSTDLDGAVSRENYPVSYEVSKPPVTNGQSKTLPDPASHEPDVVIHNGKSETTAMNKESNEVHENSIASPQTVNIQLDNSEGKVNVMQGRVETRRDGSQYINTRGIPQTWSELQQPLRQKKIRFLKIFSIIALIFFFPSGIAAVYYAFSTEREFNEGIMRGNIDRAQKFARRSERFIVLSFVMAIVVAALVVAIIERPHYSSVHRGTIVG